LKEFPSLPYPKGYILEQLGNRLIYDERNYNNYTLKEEFEELFKSLTGKYMSFSYNHIQVLCFPSINILLIIIFCF